MAAEFRLETRGGTEIEARLGDLVAAFADLTPLMDGFGVYLEGATIDRFDTESAPDGTSWEPSQRAKKDGGKTLTDSAQLRSSITSQANSSSVRVGSNKIYAGVHQFGFNETVTVKAHRRTIHQAFGLSLSQPVSFDVPAFERLSAIPARPYLGLSADDEAELFAQIDDYTADALGGAA